MLVYSTTIIQYFFQHQVIKDVTLRAALSFTFCYYICITLRSNCPIIPVQDPFFNIPQLSSVALVHS